MATIHLNSGYDIPIIGLGTWQGPVGKEREVGEAVKTAIDLGYRHFDCAYCYQNESIIGDAIAEKIKEGKVKREDLFITSKVWNTFHDPAHVLPAIQKTLKDLKLDYLDLYLMHWPHAYKYSMEINPIDPDTGLVALDLKTDYLDTWRAMEGLVTKGLTKSIGVSNFNSKQLNRLVSNCNIIPAVNQIECHPYLTQEGLRKLCKSLGIAITAYSPLGSPERPWAKPGDPDVINDPKISLIAEKYNKSPGQILLRYQVQLGNSAIPKSSNPARLKQNIEIFDFKLTQEDMDYISTFNRKDGRICPNAEASHHPEYPFQPDIEF
ncbi:Aldo/keto reductase family [Popillia japonica]|uniref:Aldo/keto reductase family n=1 Tax=Popillia japonica TaxID=7064 RepID=A0AAW1MY89_POPJA